MTHQQEQQECICGHWKSRHPGRYCNVGGCECRGFKTLHQPNKECCEKCWLEKVPFGVTTPCLTPDCPCHQPNKEESMDIDAFIRDVCSVMPRSKSEVRERLNKLLEEQFKETYDGAYTDGYLCSKVNHVKEGREQMKAQVREAIEKIKRVETKTVPAPCPDGMPGCLVYHQTSVPIPEAIALNKALQDLSDHLGL